MVVNLPDPRTRNGGPDAPAGATFPADDAAHDVRRSADLALLSRLALALRLPLARFEEAAEGVARVGQPRGALDPAAQAALSRVPDPQARDLLRRRLSELP